ncbi:putative peroxidase 61 [Quercus suber]|uniref:peroxidase n=1 Tax=Quercus suber TaxID=58331 RepID=A0AAW0JY33_QUESU
MANEKTVRLTLHLFALRGFDGRAEVNLIGACNIGKIGREFILKRLSNFKETGQPKPTVASDLLTEMRISQSLKERGLLLADQQFLANENIARLVRAYASNDGSTFQMDFSWTMMKMSELNVLTGFPGQVRQNCSLPMTKLDLQIAFAMETYVEMDVVL